MPTETRQQQGGVEVRADMPTLSPTTGTGRNLDPILPMIFARSVYCLGLGVAMDMVPSGAYSYHDGDYRPDCRCLRCRNCCRIDGGGADSGDHHATPGYRQIASVSGWRTSRWSAWTTSRAVNRQQLQLAMSAALDDLGLNGDNTAPNPQNPNGLLTKLTTPTSSPADEVTFDAFVEALAGGIDGGPWAEGLGQVALCVNAETMRKAESTFQSRHQL